nr:MAG TPA: hypothetical protein [Caudoviricetes sp.]
MGKDSNGKELSVEIFLAALKAALEVDGKKVEVSL